MTRQHYYLSNIIVHGGTPGVEFNSNVAPELTGPSIVRIRGLPNRVRVSDDTCLVFLRLVILEKVEVDADGGAQDNDLLGCLPAATAIIHYKTVGVREGLL